MIRQVAFLRGLNVGGHRVVGDDLRAVFSDLGFTEARTFLASGNVIFDLDGAPERDLTERIESALAGALGYSVPAYLRTADEVRALAAAEPFETRVVA